MLCQPEERKASAFDSLRRHGLIADFGRRFEWFVEGFMQLCLRMGDEIMKIKLTPEMVGDVGKEWREFVLSHSTPEERLMGLKPEEIETYLKKLKKSKRIKNRQIDIGK